MSTCQTATGVLAVCLGGCWWHSGSTTLEGNIGSEGRGAVWALHRACVVLCGRMLVPWPWCKALQTQPSANVWVLLNTARPGLSPLSDVANVKWTRTWDRILPPCGFSLRSKLCFLFSIRSFFPNSLATSSLLKAEESPFCSSWSIYQKRLPCTEQCSWSMNISWDRFGGDYLWLSFHGK